MFNLIKYEFIKTKNILIAAAVILAILEMGFIISGLFGLYGFFLVMSMLTVFYLIFMIIAPLVYTIHLYDIDISHKHKNGYMLFMIPENSFRIIGSKLISGIIIAVVSVFAAVAVFSADIKMAVSFVKIPSDFNVFSEFADNVSLTSDLFSLSGIMGFINGILSYTALISELYFVKMLNDAVFYNKFKFGVLISTFIFLVINAVSGYVIPAVSVKFNFAIGETVVNMNLSEVFISASGGYGGVAVSIIYNLIISVVLYIASCRICGKKLSL